MKLLKEEIWAPQKLETKNWKTEVTVTKLELYTKIE